MRNFVFTLCLLIGVIKAFPHVNQVALTCDYFNGIPDIINGYAEGIVNLNGNQTAQGSDCYQYTTIFTDKLITLYNSIINIQFSTAIMPVAYANQMFVDFSNALEACSTTTLINQIQLRTSTFSGFFNFIFTVVYEAAFGTLMQDIIYTYEAQGLTCEQVGICIAWVTTSIFSYQSPYIDPKTVQFQTTLSGYAFNATTAS